MALEPCNVCGTLNSSEAEICLSCGYPTKGRKRPLIFQYTAIALVIAFALPLLLSSISWIKYQLQPKPQPPVQKIGDLPPPSG